MKDYTCWIQVIEEVICSGGKDKGSSRVRPWRVVRNKKREKYKREDKGEGRERLGLGGGGGG